MSAPPVLLGPGAVVAVVGPSGVGKDALIDHVRAQLHDRGDDRVVIVRRVITRPPGVGEDHEPIDERGFAAARRTGAFAITWHAHGLHYGLRASIDDDVRAGRVDLANTSRTVLGALAGRYQRLVVVRVGVPEDVRLARLSARGRESATAVLERLARADPAPERAADVETVNDGPLERASTALLAVLMQSAERPPSS